MDNAPVTTTDKQPQTLKQLIIGQEIQLTTLLPKHIPPKKFMRIIFGQMQKNKKLLECTSDSVLAAVIQSATIGIIPDGRRGALVPFKNNKLHCMEATFIPMYIGLIELARNSGLIADIFPATVCENDEFKYRLGLEPTLEHTPSLRDRGKPYAYYAVVKFKDGTRTSGPGPMTMDEILAVRKRSKTPNFGPWVDDFEAMAWKTVIKRVLKFCPSSVDLEQALILDGELDNTIDLDALNLEEKEQSEINSIDSTIEKQAGLTNDEN